MLWLSLSFINCSYFPSWISSYSFETLQGIASFFHERTKYRPKIGIICGSGLGSLAESLQDADIFPYESIPNFPVSTVEGHAGQMIFGLLDNVPVMCMQGRFHYYEGYPLAKCSMPIRVMKLTGVTHLIATNAAGGLNPKYNVGDIVIVKDHINMMGLSGNNPLQGPNDARFGPRFPPMNKAYDADLRKHALQVAKDLGIQDQVHEGVYTCLGGPNYETVAELKMLRILGVDCVGMSTVHEVSVVMYLDKKKNSVRENVYNKIECMSIFHYIWWQKIFISRLIVVCFWFQVITARHCDLTAFAFSIITNKCVIDDESMEEPGHEEVVMVGKNRQNTLAELVRRMIKRIVQ